jgi:hypothetical protein
MNTGGIDIGARFFTGLALLITLLFAFGIGRCTKENQIGHSCATQHFFENESASFRADENGIYTCGKYK